MIQIRQAGCPASLVDVKMRFVPVENTGGSTRALPRSGWAKGERKRFGVNDSLKRFVDIEVVM